MDLWFCGTPASLPGATPASTNVGSQATGIAIPPASALVPSPVLFVWPPQPRREANTIKSAVYLMKGSALQESGRCNFAKSGSNHVQTCVKRPLVTIELSAMPEAMTVMNKFRPPTAEDRPGSLNRYLAAELEAAVA